MQQIYAKAEQVVVFMGDGRSHRTQRSNLVRPPASPCRIFQGDKRDELFLQEFVSLCGETGRSTKISSPESAAFCAISLVRLLANENPTDITCNDLMKFAIPTRRQLFEHLREFLVCPWWTRIWVVQEIAVSSAAVVQYGTITASWRVFSRATKALSSPGAGHSRFLSALEPENRKVLSLLMNQSSTIERTRQRWRAEGGTALVRLLQEFSHRQASDDRDKVFGLLSLAKRTHLMTPNYSLDVYQTYREAALSSIRAESSLDCWAGDQKRKNHKSLPSWVPDWSTAFDEADKRRMGLIQFYDANRGWKLHIITRELDYWFAVREQIERLVNSLDRRQTRPGPRKLPTSLYIHIEKYQQDLETWIDEGLDTGGKVDVVDAQSLRETIRGIIGLCHRLMYCCEAKGGVIKCSQLFACSYTFPSRGYRPWRSHRLGSGERLRMPETFTARSLAMQTIIVDQVESTGPRMHSWSHKETAMSTLRHWFRLATEKVNVISGMSEIEHRDIYNFANTVVAGLCRGSTGHLRIKSLEGLESLTSWFLENFHEHTESRSMLQRDSRDSLRQSGPSQSH